MSVAVGVGTLIFVSLCGFREPSLTPAPVSLCPPRTLSYLLGDLETWRLRVLRGAAWEITSYMGHPSADASPPPRFLLPVACFKTLLVP